MKRRKIYIILLIILAIITLGLGITYAWLKQNISSEKVQVMRVGNFNFSLKENSIGLLSGEFLADETALKKEGYKFSIENTGNFIGSYSIYLDDDTLETNQIRLDDKFIKYSLEIDGDIYEPKELSDRKIYEGVLKRGEKTDFILRVWLNSDINGDIGGQVFKTKLRVEASQEPTSSSETSKITYDYNYLVNDVFDEYYDINKFDACCNTNDTLASLIAYKTYYDNVGRVFSVTSNKFKTYAGWYFPPKKELTIGKTYSYSFEAKSNVTLTAIIGSEQEGTKFQNGNIKYEITPFYKRYTRTFKANTNIIDNKSYTAFIFYNWTDTEDRTLEIRNLQFQEGGLSTSDLVKKSGTKLGLFPHLVRNNYQLLGWYTDPIEGTKVSEDDIVPASDTTYYAHWKYLGGS